MRTRRHEALDEDHDVRLAPPVTPQQQAQLARLRYRGPTPSTAFQAAEILKTLGAKPAKKTTR